MVSGIRTVLFWLLLIALPLVALAGGAMRGCEGMQMHVSSAAPTAIASTIGAPHAGSDAIGEAARPAAVCSDMATADDEMSGASLGNCAASMTCGVVAAPAMQSPAFLPVHLVSTLPVLPLASGAGFLTDAPDRPPRTFA